MSVAVVVVVDILDVVTSVVVLSGCKVPGKEIFVDTTDCTVPKVHNTGRQRVEE